MFEPVWKILQQKVLVFGNLLTIQVPRPISICFCGISAWFIIRLATQRSMMGKRGDFIHFWGIAKYALVGFENQKKLNMYKKLDFSYIFKKF